MSNFLSTALLDSPPECRSCCRGPEDCSHEHCHSCMGHVWQEWTVYPECQFCEADMLAYWADEIAVAA